MLRVILGFLAVLLVLVFVIVFPVVRDVLKSYSAYEKRHGKRD